MSDSTPGIETHGKVRSSKRWIILGSIGIVAVVVVLVIVYLRLTTHSLVTADKLDSALLDVEQVNTMMGAFDMQMGEPERAPATPTSALSKPGCLGALTAAQAPTYAASGYTELRRAEAKEPAKIEHYVAQAVAAFPDTDKASAFVKDSADQWKICAGQTVFLVSADKSVVGWKLNTVIGDPPNITISETRQDVPWTCQRALRAVSNVVVDATACGFDITEQGRSIAAKIAANISK